MAFGYTGGATDSATGGGDITLTHGQTINSGDLEVLIGHVNGLDVQLTPGAGAGAAWIELYGHAGPDSAGVHLWWKIANASEPSSYTITNSGGAQSRVCIKVFTSSSDAEVFSSMYDSGAGTTNDMVCAATRGQVAPAAALGIIAGFKDSRTTAEAYTVVNNSYGSVLGNVEDQATSMAHRIYGAGQTELDFDVTIETADGDDSFTLVTASIGVLFTEGPFTGNVGKPYIAGEGITQSGINTTTHTVNLPADIIDGDGLVLMAGADGGATTFGVPAGWTELDDQNGGSGAAMVAYRDADGTETATIAVTTNNNEKAGFRVLKVRGVDFGDAAPELSTVNAQEPTSAPNPSSVTHSTGATRNYLYVAMASCDSSNTRATAVPTDYDGLSAIEFDAGSAAGTGYLNTASRTIMADDGTEDPGTFTIQTSQDCLSFTVAMHGPVLGGGAGGAVEIAQAFGIL